MRFQIGKILLVLIAAVSLTSCARRSQNFYFGDYSEAERHYSKAEYEKAIEKYEEYRQENPEGNLAVIAQYYIAKSHQSLGDLETARKNYQEIIQNHPDLVWANFSETQLKEMDAKTA